MSDRCSTSISRAFLGCVSGAKSFLCTCPKDLELAPAAPAFPCSLDKTKIRTLTLIGVTNQDGGCAKNQRENVSKEWISVCSSSSWGVFFPSSIRTEFVRSLSRPRPGWRPPPPSRAAFSWRIFSLHRAAIVKRFICAFVALQNGAR